MYDIESWLIYGLFMLASCILAFITERRNYNPVWLCATYLFVVGFWSVRYKIGFDYLGYMKIFEAVKYGSFTFVEPGFKLLNQVFTGSPYGYIGVIVVMAAVSYLFLFKLFVRERILVYGLFFSLAFQLQFMMTNQMRQAFVIVVFLYALHFIEQKHYWRFVFCILPVACIHFTALFMLAALVFARIRIPRLFWVVTIFITYMAYLGGLFRSIGTTLMSMLPFYEQYKSTGRMVSEVQGFSIVMLFWILITFLLLMNQKTIERPVLFNIYMIGMTCYIIFFEFSLLTRMMQYFTFINVILASILCRNDFRKGLLLLIISYLAFNLLSIKTPNLHGVQPYNTIFQQKPLDRI